MQNNIKLVKAEKHAQVIKNALSSVFLIASHIKTPVAEPKTSPITMHPIFTFSGYCFIHLFYGIIAKKIGLIFAIIIEKVNMMNFIDGLNYDSGAGPTGFFILVFLAFILGGAIYIFYVFIRAKHKKSKITKSKISKVDTKKTPK